MKLLGKFLSILSVITYILILGVLIIAAPMVMGYKPVVVLTGSMEPTYPVGSVVYYKKVPVGDLNVGDPITFSITDDAKTVVTHRINKVLSDGKYETKGDANSTPDTTPVSFSNVKGKVIKYHLPLVGYFVKYLQNYYVIAGIFLILVSKLIVDYINDSREESKNESNNNVSV